MRNVPVVSLNVNPNNIFSEKQIGFCSGNYIALRNNVIRLIEDNDLRTRFGIAAQAYAFDKHSEKEGNHLLSFF